METTTTNPAPADQTNAPSAAKAAPVLKALRPPLNTAACTTLKKLEEALVQHVTLAMLELVAEGDPLAKNSSTAVWLLPDLSVVTEDIEKISRRFAHKVAKGRKLIELFRGQAHASPSSRFHEWHDADDGKYYGIPGRVCSSRSPLYYRHNAVVRAARTPEVQAHWAHVGWKRFRIAPVTPGVLTDCVMAGAYQTELEEGINTWLFRGHCPRAFESLNFATLKLAAACEGRRLEDALGGPAALHDLLLRKAVEHLRDKLDEIPGE